MRDETPLQLQDDDHLPWLEPVESDEPTGPGPGAGKLIGVGLAALLAVGIVAGGSYLWRERAPETTGGTGALIAADPAPYKVKPDSPGGMKIEGQGDTTFATSQGEDVEGQIATDRIAEAPVALPGPPPQKVEPKPEPAKVVTAKVPTGAPPLKAKPPAAPAPSPFRNAPSGSVVQLGAFASEAVANEQWVRLTKRFAYLEPLQKSVEVAEVGGKTYYRLRANAGEEAASVCGKLRVAGESCLLVK